MTVVPGGLMNVAKAIKGRNSTAPWEPQARVDFAEVERRFHLEYGQPRRHNPLEPLDDLIFVLLSRMTEGAKYPRMYIDECEVSVSIQQELEEARFANFCASSHQPAQAHSTEGVHV